jgi:hypothetical protein
VNFRTFCILLAAGVVSCLGFAFAYQRYQESREVSAPDELQSPMAQTAAVTQRSSVAPLSYPAVTSAASLVAVPSPAIASVPTAGASSDDAPAKYLPVAFHIRNLRDRNRIEGEARNISSIPMSLTIRAVNASTQGITELQLELAPGETKSYSTDNGLVMMSHDQIILHSPPYQDRTVRVP